MRRAWGRAAAALLPLLLLRAAAQAPEMPSWTPQALPVEEIDLDLPPSTRWTAFAQKYRSDIISRCKHQAKMYQVSLGSEVAGRWVGAAGLSEELREEYRGIVNAINHTDVTFDRLVLVDMWQAVDAPTFECTGLLAAMPNGTVVHGRNIDYDMERMAEQARRTGAGMGGGPFLEIVFLQGGRPVAEFLANTGSLGIHTGMRFGAYSVNSNARPLHNKMMLNLQAAEAGGSNFPWLIRRMLQYTADFESAVKLIETTELNAPNYFILAGSEPWQGAVVTKDRLGTHELSTPPTQRLDPSRGIWHLVQTNDDLLSPPEDARRGVALSRLSESQQSMVDMDFVQHEMMSSPVMNTDTLLTWVADPQSGTHRVLQKPQAAMIMGLVVKQWHRQHHVPLPQDLPPAQSSFLRGSRAGA